MKAVIYRRVSTGRQAEDGASLVDQESDLVAYCKSRKWEIVGNCSDSASGWKASLKHRPGMRKALKLCQDEQAALVIYDLSRLARSVVAGGRIIEDLKSWGCPLVVLKVGIDTSTSVGELVTTILLAVAKWESDAKSDYIKRANRAIVRAKGYRTQGRQPYGYAIQGGQRVPVDSEQQTIRRARTLRRGGLSLAAIAAQLDDEGLLPRNGGSWAPGTIAKIVSERKIKL